MTDKESLTHEIEDDLAARNRNWNKVDRNTTNIAENTTNIAENTTNIDSHMLKTAEDNAHGLANAVIVESGSNYVKFGDGTMQIWGKGTLTYAQNTFLTTSWSLPRPFVGDYSVTFSHSLPPSGKRDGIDFNTMGYQPERVSLRAYDEKARWTSGDTITVDMMAIGKWK